MYSSNQKTPTRKNLKSTLSAEDGKIKRMDKQSSLRKKMRDELLQKRRKENTTGATIHDPLIQEKLNQLPLLLEQVKSGNPTLQLEATVQFRKLLSMEKSPPIDEVISTGVVPIFVEFLQRVDHAALQFEACWALTNIASGTSEHTETVIRSNAVPIFIQLLGCPNDDVREQSIWALGNIAGDSAKCRDYILQMGVMVPLLSIISEQPKVTILRNATWTVSNLCRGKPIPDFNLVAPALPTLAHLLYNSDEEVLTDACWAISYLSDGPNNRIQAVIDSNVVRRLVELLMHPQPSVQTPALRTIGNIVTGNDQQTQVVLNCGALPSLCQLLQHQKKSIKKEACWTISNITAGNKDQIQTIIDANIIPPLVAILDQPGDFDVKKEAAWAISNATSGGSDEQIRYLVDRGCIKPLCELLSVKDVKVVGVALEGIENILASGSSIADDIDGINPYTDFIEEAGGVDKLESLTDHASEEIYKKAYKIVEEYFGLDDDDEEPQTTQNNQFVFTGMQQNNTNFNFE
ncbi:predicted protein [Naegleria gruberi]|uniref:Importin subunit alpha n=1 Tax=Naegleria gruberi TaxID=5762 RepID=D2V5V6_NAEGR|nr:uncharacterized protein NAEGRDRAFT_78705 [Naegleria gruberi]EFC47863.1 predicted protein [Naegleria gruberi]|eukprot:XP_002680607.1 predicted protein [Naegleria gruberi strain NEG-M]